MWIRRFGFDLNYGLKIIELVMPIILGIIVLLEMPL